MNSTLLISWSRLRSFNDLVYSKQLIVYSISLLQTLLVKLQRDTVVASFMKGEEARSEGFPYE